MDNSHLDDTFIQLINQNLGIAHKVCRIYFQDEDDRQDVIQEMMFQLWRSFSRFDGRSKFSTWMYSVCLNTALTYRKKNNKSAERLSEMHHQIADHAQAQNDEPTKLLLAAIATLSPLNKAIVLLYLENLSYDEIAEITGISKSNVSVRLVRIKKELEQKIKHKIQ